VTAAEVVVIGAGIAGLLAARDVRAAGHRVVVLEEAWGVGGRLATRWVAGARIDHGAQFFTVRHEAFARLADRWQREAVVREWCRGFSAEPDGHPRYVGVRGMADLAEELARGLDVRTSSPVASIARRDRGWSVAAEGVGERAADAVICTAAVPQTLALLDAGDVAPGPSAAAALAGIRYEPCVALLVALDRPSAIPPPGGVQLDNGVFHFVGDNQAKGISEVPALTFHASGEWSRRHLDDDPAAITDRLLAEARRWIGAAAVVEAQLVRWRYSRPVALHHERCVSVAGGPAPLVCAGDAFGEAKVEGAARSGWAAAAAVNELLGRG